jgi:very-short-patch-repair endonuclease
VRFNAKSVESHFKSDVYDALCARGIEIVPQVGCSKFRIDLAASHPDEPGRFVLAIECDGATYHSSYTARDRDRLRQQQLENLGWTFHRIWSTDWFMRRDEEVERAVQAFRKAVAASDSPKSARALQAIATATQLVPTSQLTARSSSVAPIPTRQSITEYSEREILSLLAWVQSDGKLRTHDEIADEMFATLPFTRRGSKIEAVLTKAIELWELTRDRR